MIATLLVICSLNVQARDTLIKEDASATIVLAVNSASVKEILEELEQQTNFHFFYNHKAMRNSDKISMSLNNVTLEGALLELGERADLVFRFRGDQIVVKNATATFYAKASGTSMIGAGIDDGDILVIDKSLEPQDGKIAVCFIDGEFTVKRIKVQENSLLLLPENPSFEPIEVTQENDFVIWGIVTYVVKKI